MRFRILLCGVAGALCLPLVAQEALVSRLETLGQATVYAPPTHVEFWLHFQARDASTELAMDAVQAFEGKLHEAVTAAELRPSSSEIAAPTVPDVRDNRVVVSAVLRFSMIPLAHPDTGPGEFARLCDKMRALARELECEVTGPVLDTTERNTLQQAALNAAAETAYPAAEALSRTLNTNVWAVENVQVLEVLWNEPLEFQGLEPTLRQMSCTAKVRVTYALRAGG
jgi:uncharacterized protein YggE